MPFSSLHGINTAMVQDLTPVLNAEEVESFLERAFPQVAGDFAVTDLRPGGITIALVPSDKHLRPGGTISGPTLFALADCAAYLAIIAHVGEEALAVTTNASIDFMRKPAADQPLTAEVTLLKLGRALVVSDVAIKSGGSPDLVARATLTYSRPRS